MKKFTFLSVTFGFSLTRIFEDSVLLRVKENHKLKIKNPNSFVPIVSYRACALISKKKITMNTQRKPVSDNGHDQINDL